MSEQPFEREGEDQAPEHDQAEQGPADTDAPERDVQQGRGGFDDPRSE